MPEPTQDAISARAHAIWLRRGATPGKALDDWLQAERELRAESAKTTSPSAPSTFATAPGAGVAPHARPATPPPAPTGSFAPPLPPAKAPAGPTRPATPPATRASEGVPRPGDAKRTNGRDGGRRGGGGAGGGGKNGGRKRR
jgi:hypothetical protein